MPSQRSISESAYYAHPRNAFWWIMSELLDFPEGLNYQEKLKQVRLSEFGLWDVLYDCHRPGSLDSNIQRDSEHVNDFDQFLSDYRSIKLIAFNGAAARQIFMRHCKKILEKHEHVNSVQLPSTSPAYASLSREKKLEQWRASLCLR